MSKKRLYLNYSRLFNPYRVSEEICVNSFCDELYEQICSTSVYQNRPNKEELLNNIKALVLDLYIAHCADNRLKIAIHKDSGWYTESRYQTPDISYRRMVKVIAALVELRFIKEFPGYHNRGDGIGRLTRLRAKQSLINSMEGFGIRPNMIAISESEETVILRDANKNEVDYLDYEDTDRMREELRLINENLQSAQVSLYLDDSAFEELSNRIWQDRETALSNYMPVDFSRKKLVRIFNNTTFEDGGRLYRGWWQEIPSGYRKHIQINHGDVVEVDYSGMQMRMIYANKGIAPPDDPYEIEGIPSEDRKRVKKAMNTIINASSEASAIASIKEKLSLENAEEFCSLIKNQHEQISDMFYSGEGIRLQKLDSDMAVQIILRMKEKYNATVLPVHDSFIVRAGYEDQLVEIMDEVFHDLFGVNGLPKKEVSLRSERYEEGVIHTLEGEEAFLSVIEEQQNYRKYYKDISDWNP